MSLDINPKAGMVNSLIQRLPELNVSDASKAGYVENFKKADTDGNGRISQDEFKRYAKDALSSSVDLAQFGDMDVIMSDFDEALDDWFSSLNRTEASAGIGLRTNSNIPPDTGKTRMDLAAEKIARGEELNFGHKKVDGELWKMQDGMPIWADTGTQVTEEQLAAMPDYQVKKFYEMAGLGYDPKAVWLTDGDRQFKADSVRHYAPGSIQNEIFENRRGIVVDLANLQGRFIEKIEELEAKKETADANLTKQIDAQIAQLLRVLGPVTSMRQQIEAIEIPNSLTSEEGARLNATLNEMAKFVRTVPGMDNATMTQSQARFAQLMNQARNPGMDVEQDPLFSNQFNAMVNATNIQGRLLDRMDMLVRNSVNADEATQQQIDAQMTQLQRTYDGITEIATNLFALRPEAALSPEERLRKAKILHELDLNIRQIAGADAEMFQVLLEGSRKLFDDF